MPEQTAPSAWYQRRRIHYQHLNCAKESKNNLKIEDSIVFPIVLPHTNDTPTELITSLKRQRLRDALNNSWWEFCVVKLRDEDTGNLTMTEQIVTARRSVCLSPEASYLLVDGRLGPDRGRMDGRKRKLLELTTETSNVDLSWYQNGSRHG